MKTMAAEKWFGSKWFGSVGRRAGKQAMEWKTGFEVL
jgi:hypothetical protein